VEINTYKKFLEHFGLSLQLMLDEL
jgi:hypothetical protein